jgi:prolyl 4-hydroxylase
MQFSSLADELQAWFRQSTAAGHSRESLEQSLRASGYERKFARRAVAAAFDALCPAQAVTAAHPGTATGPDPAELATGTQPMPLAEGEPESSTHILAGQPNVIDAGDRQVKLLFALNAPRIVLFGDLLSTEECETLIRMSHGKLSRSSVVDRESGNYEVHPDRTSEGTHFRRQENELVAVIERRIAELTSSPLEHGEPIQVLHYRPGTLYRPHFDFFDPSDPGNHRVLQQGGQRIATLIMYLNNVEAGGSTVFPDIGLDVLPQRGQAVYFAYCDAEGRLDKRTLHGGSAVTSGEKWIATKWIRQANYVDLSPA